MPSDRSSGSTVSQSSKRFGQRGWKEQPDGSSRGSGGSPGSPAGANRAAGSPIARERRRQGTGVGVQRVGEDLVGGSVLDDPAGVHHGDPVAQVGQHRQVVADHQQPDVELRDQVLQHVEHLRLHHHVQRGGRLVGDDQPRPAGQRHRDHHPLLLAAGDLVRVRARPCSRQPDLLEQLADPAVDPLLRQVGLVQPDRLGDLGPDPLHRVERVQRALEDHRGAGPAQRPQRAPLHGQHVLALEEHPAGHRRARRLQPEDGRGQRGLAAAGLPRDPDDLARGDGQGDATDRGYVAPAGPVGDARRRRTRGGCSSASPQPRVEDLFERLPDQGEARARRGRRRRRVAR